jgi:hypothetical protein
VLTAVCVVVVTLFYGQAHLLDTIQEARKKEGDLNRFNGKKAGTQKQPESMQHVTPKGEDKTANSITADKKVSIIHNNMKIPLPVFVLSLPKSGTTSTHRYFACGNQPSTHWATRNATNHRTTLGQCWSNNYRQNRPMLEGCASTQIFSDVGYIYTNDRERDWNNAHGYANCFYPSIHGGLDNIATFYPHATILLVTRNATVWAQRIKHWHDIHHRWIAECEGFPKGKYSNRPTKQTWADFYQNHARRIREFVRLHPSITYIEVELESSDTGRILEDATGISRECWGDCPPENLTKCTTGAVPLISERARQV